jgi:hypothetical protein
MNLREAAFDHQAKQFDVSREHITAGGACFISSALMQLKARAI